MEIQIRATQHAIAIIVLCYFVSQNTAQVQEQQCINEFQPCMNYLSSNSHPSDSCCQNLDYVIKSMPECLCSLMSVQGSNQAEQAGINTTQAQTLPGRCGQHINPLGCITGTPDTRSKNSVPNSSDSIVRWCSSRIIVLAAVIAMFVIFKGL